MTVTPATRAALRERAHGCCERCGAPGATNAHHRVNQSQGGADTLANLMLVCGSGTTGCHGWITVNPKAAMRFGYTVPRGADPAAIPVHRFARETATAEMVFLADDGTITPLIPAEPVGAKWQSGD